MERVALLVLLSLTSTICDAQAQRPPKEGQRYQIVSTSNGLHSIFRVETVTGEVSYCYVISTSPDFNVPATGVRCVAQAR
jgi:hypothetical protein